MNTSDKHPDMFAPQAAHVYCLESSGPAVVLQLDSGELANRVSHERLPGVKPGLFRRARHRETFYGTDMGGRKGISLLRTKTPGDR